MTPADFGAWAFTLIFVAAGLLVLIAAVFVGVVLAAGWLDERSEKRKGNHR